MTPAETAKLLMDGAFKDTCPRGYNALFIYAAKKWVVNVQLNVATANIAGWSKDAGVNVSFVDSDMVSVGSDMVSRLADEYGKMYM